MNSNDKKTDELALDDSTIELLGSAPPPVELDGDFAQKLRSRVMSELDQSLCTSAGFVTVRADQGQWEQLTPLIEKKLLSRDAESGLENFLLRIQPGAEQDPHRHESDEVCLVLKGEVEIDGLQLTAGDYHFAPKGSVHGHASSQAGALLYIQGAMS